MVTLRRPPQFERRGPVLEPYQVVIRPLITEKATHLSERHNAYTFETMIRRATMNDIARLCGFSKMTVSRALAGRPGVRPEARRIIATAAKKLGVTENTLKARLWRARHQLAERLGRRLRRMKDDVTGSNGEGAGIMGEGACSYC